MQKTGYIEEAGRCLVMQTVIEGRTIVIVLLNSFGKQTRVADATRVRKWMEAKLAGAAAALPEYDLSPPADPAEDDGLASRALGNLRPERDVPLAIFRPSPSTARRL